MFNFTKTSNYEVLVINEISQKFNKIKKPYYIFFMFMILSVYTNDEINYR